MDINMVPHVAQHLIDKHGLGAKRWRFAWDHARRRAGCCKHGKRLITMSRHYVELNLETRPDDIIDTILHEIAHALAGPREGHGDKWKDICCQIGARPKRCCSSEVEMPIGRYVATCGGCGKQFHKHKQPRLAAGRWMYCVKCGRDAGRLTFTDSTATPATPREPIKDTPPAPRRLR